MYRTEASRRNQWEGGIEKETERKLRGLRELREEGRRSRESGSEFASFARLREAGSRSAERFGPAKREDLKAREPGSLHSPSRTCGHKSYSPANTPAGSECFCDFLRVVDEVIFVVASTKVGKLIDEAVVHLDCSRNRRRSILAA